MKSKVTYSEDQNTAYFNGDEFIATDESNVINDDIGVCGHCDLDYTCSSSFMCLAEKRLDGKTIFWVEKEKPVKQQPEEIVTKYHTPDGTVFTEKTDAERHNAFNAFKAKFGIDKTNWVMSFANDITQFIDAMND